MRPAIEWRPVPAYEGLYDLGPAGEVWSFPRQGTRGGLLSPWPGSNGYLHVWLHRGRERVVFAIHQLVALVYIGERPSDTEVCHRDDDHLNNHWTNLYYGTHPQNVADAIRNGKHNLVPPVPVTQCLKGHEYTPQNTLLFPSDGGSRRCRKCREERYG